MAKKIMFSDKYGLTEAVLTGRKTQTRRIVPDSTPVGCWEETEAKARYKVGEVVAVAQSYKDCGNFPDDGKYDEDGYPIMPKNSGYFNKLFVRADLMPNRIRITNVRVERLQDISDEDCIKEGIYPYYYGDEKEKIECGFYPDGFSFDGIDCHYPTPREAYAVLIDRISGKGTWESNPYVFVYDFELVK